MTTTTTRPMTTTTTNNAPRARAFAAPRGGAAPLLPEWCPRGMIYGVPILDRAHESAAHYRRALALALKVTGGLSFTSKMPGASYSIPAQFCITGGKLHEVAGSVCAGCYALKARYLFPVVRAALRRRFRALSHPLWVPCMAFLINHQRADRAFRWHDAGDLQSLEHLERIVGVVKLTPFIDHWIPTREVGIVGAYHEKHGAFPRALRVRLSAFMVDGPAPVALAKRVGAGVSTVTTDPDRVTCPAYAQGGACGTCRACWGAALAIAYPKH